MPEILNHEGRTMAARVPLAKRRAGLNTPRPILKLLDRYVLRSFFEPFLLCFAGFLGIWLIFDLSGNLGDFQEGKAGAKTILGFYATQLPAFINVCLPVGLLLALLFSLSKMSRTNELIAQLTAGRSVFRIITPLLFVGLLGTAVLAALNYELAPHSDGVRKAALEQIRKGRKKLEAQPLEGHLFKDRQTNRTWFVKKMRPGSPTLDDVLVIQQDDAGHIISKWYADRADYDARHRAWQLRRGIRDDFDLEGEKIRTENFLQGFLTLTTWSETPERIAAANVEPQNLSVPELRDYLKQNADFPAAALAPFRTYLEHRRALPWTCLVVVLIAAPLGIVFSRRGVLAGVASSIFIFFGMIFLTNLCLALGRGDRVSAFTAAWFPNLAIGTLGLLLLWLRQGNRDLAGLFSKRR
jgi:LPS export ABC transporter permease LptG